MGYGKHCNKSTIMFTTPSERKLGHKIILWVDEVITKMQQWQLMVVKELLVQNKNNEEKTQKMLLFENANNELSLMMPPKTRDVISRMQQ